MKELLVFLILTSQFIIISCNNNITSPSYEVSEYILGEYQTTSVAFDSKNVAWIGTFRQGLIKYDGTTTIYDNTNSILPDSLILWTVEVDKNDVVWIGSNKGLIKYENNIFHIYNKTNAPFVTDNVFAITVDKDNSLWFTSCVFRTGGIMKFDGTNWDLFTPQNSELPGSLTSDIITDKDNNKWATINDGNDGCSIVKINGNNFTSFSSDKIGIPLYYFGSLAHGPNNYIYVSLDYILSSLYDNTRPNIIMYNGNDWEVINPVYKNGKTFGYVGQIATDLNGNLWASTADGIAVYNGHKWNKVNTELEIYTSFSGNITPDKNNKIWITTGEGIYIIE
jgi:ligand-binding sensor domain-containing protein